MADNKNIDDVIARINGKSSVGGNNNGGNNKDGNQINVPKKKGIVRKALGLPVKLVGNVAGFVTRPVRNYVSNHKGPFIIAGLISAGVLTGAGFLGYGLLKESIVKRQHYPERNVLFRALNVTYVAGGTEVQDSKLADLESIYKIYEGTKDSKMGTYLFETTREIRDDIETFNMDNSQKIRIASAVKKPELVQAGWSFTGGINFKEDFAEMVLADGKSKQKYILVKFVPERTSQEVEIAMTENDSGVKSVRNRMVDMRYGPHGWYFGKEYRKGTVLSEFTKSKEDLLLQEQFLGNVLSLDKEGSTNPKVRVKLLKDAMGLEKDLNSIPIYISYEDGIIDWWPQGSTIYLGKTADDVSLLNMWKNKWFNPTKKDNLVIRVDNDWNLWPGYFPFLSQVSFGDGKNSVYPFNKYNNGGYTIKDNQGEIAKVVIEDFIFKYGQDALYKYYLDLNGDGKLSDDELIGKVLCTSAKDEIVDLEREVGKGISKTDITLALSYSFMSPSEDFSKGMEYFHLCGDIESLMPDQIHRGFGLHSNLGNIKEQRADIMLYRDLMSQEISREQNIRNMSRVLTQESALVAKEDIVRVLLAAKRPYANEVAKMYGVDVNSLSVLK